MQIRPTSARIGEISMGISDKSRKMLWAQSGNRCAFCKQKLVMEKTERDAESIVGDECHIIAQSHNGPRGDSSWTEEQIHDYENLILLCKTHHKLIDDQPLTFTREILVQIKKQHEQWVDVVLEKGSSNHKDTGDIAVRLTSGQDVITILSNTYLFDFSNDDPDNEAELEIISDFMQEIRDYTDIADVLEGGDIVRLGYGWTQKIRQMEEMGFQVYGTKYTKVVLNGEKRENWLVSYIRVVRENNPRIYNISL